MSLVQRERPSCHPPAPERAVRFGGAVAVLLTGLLSETLLGGCAAPPRERAGRPNVVLITVESTRADHVGCYGYARSTTPALSELAREGRLFERAYAVTSWTLPSHASLFTGLYPAAHRVVDFRGRLDDSHTTLAERLREAGYQTAGFVSGPFLQTQHNLHQGFEIYDTSASNPAGNQAAHGDVTNPHMERLLEDFLRRQRDPRRPFLLFAYLWDPHYDYIPPAPYDDVFVDPAHQPIDLHDYEIRNVVHPGISPAQLGFVIAQYDGELLWTDALLGKLWSLLRAMELWDDTIVIVTSDHGEEFFEHGGKGHRNNLYEESVHVPLIVKAPGQHPGRDDRLVSHVDVYPTVLELIGLDHQGPRHGRSLFGPPAADRELFFELKTEWVVRDPASGERAVASDLWLAVRRGDWKMVLTRNERRQELFDLAGDPREGRSLAASHPAELARLDRGLTQHVERMQRDAAQWAASPPAALSREQEERLRALGYIGN